MQRGVGAALLLAVACGGDVSASAQDDFQKACAESAQVGCTKVAECSSPTGKGVPSEIEACVPIATEICLRRAGMKRPHAGAADIAACTATTRAQTCEEYGGSNGCAYTGPRANGERCVYQEECKSGFCDFDGISPCGTCATGPREGDSCKTSCPALEHLCIPDSAGVSRCTRLPSEGEACDTGPCQSGLVCYQGSCIAMAAKPGDACDASAGVYCDSRRFVYCNPITSTCLPRALADPGGVCGQLPDGTVARCAPREYCFYPLRSDRTGTCAAFLEDGAPCEPFVRSSASSVHRCKSPAMCTAPPGSSMGTCQVAGADFCEM